MQRPTITQEGTDGVPEGASAGLGPLLFKRRSWLAGVIGGVVFGTMAAAFAVATGAAFSDWASGTGNLALALGLAAFTLLPVGISALSVATAFTRVLFFEHGVVRKSVYRTIAIPYDDVAILEYKLERQFANGVYTGTVVGIALSAVDGRRIQWRGRHQERRRGLLRVRYEGRDGLDDIKAFVAELIADRMMDEILAGRPVPWTPSAQFGEEGLTPLSGPKKGQPIPYGQLERIDAEHGRYLVYTFDEKPPVLVLRADEPNFWPGLTVLGRLAEAIARPDQTVMRADRRRIAA